MALWLDFDKYNRYFRQRAWVARALGQFVKIAIFFYYGECIENKGCDLRKLAESNW